MTKINNWTKDFTSGLIEENPVLRLMIGLCPALAVSSLAVNGLGMGLAATFVLVASNLVTSLLRKTIPSEIRIPVFIIIVSTFVTVVDYLMKAYFPELHQALGVFVPLIVVNCIILGRVEAFAYKNSPVRSFLDGLGMGLGFTLAITAIGIIREALGSGSVFGLALFPPDLAALVMILPPGAFLTIGFLMALLNLWERKTS